MIVVGWISQERAQCRTASGSEQMLQLTMNRAFGRIQQLSACIRSLPLAVLHQLHVQIESTRNELHFTVPLYLSLFFPVPPVS